MVTLLKPDAWPFSTDEERAAAWAEPRFDRRRRDRRATLDRATPPPGTRLVLMSEELCIELGATRVDWGKPDQHGWYTPTLYADPRPLATDVPSG